MGNSGRRAARGGKSGRCWPGLAALVFALLPVGAWTVAAHAGGDGQAGPADAAGYLAFETVLDGRCQILSAGGKLRLVSNTHPDRAIRYRLVRVFAGKPQAGRVTGTLGPGEGPIKLGCTLVDGREQNWAIVTAAFTDSEAP